jgi:acyl-CoA dehydrogenase
VPASEEVALGRLEAALAKATAALRVEAKLRDAVRRGALDHAPGDELARAGLAAGVIDARELEALAAADEARDEVIQVDAFDAASFPVRRRYASPP